MPWCYDCATRQNMRASSTIKPGSQYDARASVASRASGWCWNRLDFYFSVALRVLASIQPIRLFKNLTSGMQFDWWKKILIPLTLTAPASYREPSYIHCSAAPIIYSMYNLMIPSCVFCLPPLLMKVKTASTNDINTFSLLAQTSGKVKLYNKRFCDVYDM